MSRNRVYPGRAWLSLEPVAGVPGLGIVGHDRLRKVG